MEIGPFVCVRHHLLEHRLFSSMGHLIVPFLKKKPDNSKTRGEREEGAVPVRVFCPQCF